LTWEKVTTAPQLDEVEVDDIQERDDAQWVVFHYLEEDMEGLKGGAPIEYVLTEKEGDLVMKAWAHIDSCRAEARKLNKKAKETMKEVLKQFSDPEREIL
jgi:hypothetical protein